MRKNKYILRLLQDLLRRGILIILLLPFVSCQEWLELVPPNGLVQNEYWKNRGDVEATLMGAYQKFAQMDDKLFIYGEIRGDMVTTDANTPNNQRQIMRGDVFPDNILCNWQDFYRVINYCNFVLKYARDVYEIDPAFTEFQLRSFEAEATYLRSLAYFYLVRIFKDVPLVLEPSESDAVNFFLPKSSDTDVLGVIKENLLGIARFTRDVYASEALNKGRATKVAVYSLLADISLWNFEYEECLSYIDLVESFDLTLLPSTQWFTNYYPGNSLESIFEFQFDDQLTQPNGTYDLTYFWKSYLASSVAIEALSISSGQSGSSGETVRGLGSIVEYSGKIWKYTGAAADSRTERPNSEKRSANWIVHRYADILLMKAEALSQTGRFDEALEIINDDIRSRVKMVPLDIPYNEHAFEDAILAERAKEFAFEGKRWFDMLRMGRRNNYERKETLIKLIIERVPASQKLVIASKLTDPLGWYLPIYDKELERNTALEQNPYYEDYTKD